MAKGGKRVEVLMEFQAEIGRKITIYRVCRGIDGALRIDRRGPDGEHFKPYIRNVSPAEIPKHYEAIKWSVNLNRGSMSATETIDRWVAENKRPDLH